MADSVINSPGVVRPARGPEELWKRSLREAVRDPRELCRLLGLPEGIANRAATADFPLLVPRGFVARMRPGDPADPLLRQVLPLTEELNPVAGFVADPVADGAARAAPGLLHKYHGRALLVTTGACAVHCRYCFRRHFDYHNNAGPAAWGPALDRVASDPTIEEVILSGGDPLSLVDTTLRELVAQIAAIPHVRRLRVHSRWPVMIPERVTGGLVRALTQTRLTLVVVIHANHANELDSSVAESLRPLAAGGGLLLNQAALLRGVNDDTATLADLSARLVEIGVAPYYLNQLDRVAGGAHFEVPIDRGLALMAELRRTLPGYMVPRYVVDRPGAPQKVELLGEPDSWESAGGDLT